VLQFVDAESQSPLPVYHTLALRNAIRENPFRAPVNVNMIRN
jgi:hypothetical protein